MLDWYEDRAQRLGAALAYYTIFALAPGLIIVMALAGMLLGPGAEQQILLEVQELIGEQGATAIAALIQNARGETLGATVTALALIPLIFGLWGVFGELQDGLNTIWGVTPKPGRRVIAIIKQRFWSFAMVVGTGFVLLVSLVVSAWLAAVGIGYLLPAPALVLETVNFVLSLVVITAAFALIFKLLPDVHVAWSDVWLGAALTSFFFTLGKFVIGLYLGKSAVASAYGAASSLVIVLLGSNPSIRRRVYKSVDQTPRRRCDPREDGGADHPRSSRRARFGATARGIGCPSLRPARWASGPWVGVQRALLAHPDGMLKSELLTRQWAHVDLRAGWLRLEPGETKNGEGRPGSAGAPAPSRPGPRGGGSPSLAVANAIGKE